MRTQTALMGQELLLVAIIMLPANEVTKFMMMGIIPGAYDYLLKPASSKQLEGRDKGDT